MSRKPEFKSFRTNLIEFYNHIINKAAEYGLLYDDERFMENLKIWFTAMSSSNLRSFRHTSTLVFLTILTELCRLHVSSSKSANQNEKIITAENKKSRPSKARLKAAQEGINLASSHKEYLHNMMKDIFDTVFVHRYRDIDPKIRAECIRELGLWMDILPSLFFESQYLRYFGWLLSDIHGATRLEVIKALSKLYGNSDNIIGFRQFTERFRPRLVEMSAMDADISVRVATVDLLTSLRDVGFLEDEDVEIVSSLIYDNEARVRKATSRFLVSHVVEQAQNAHGEFNASKLTELKKKFPQLVDAWLAFKELSNLLKVDNNGDRPSGSSLASAQTDLQDLYPTRSSRISVAGEALWEAGIGEKWDWPALVSQLLFDFSSLDSVATDSHSERFIELYSLNTSEAILLLEALYGFVKGSQEAILRTKTSDYRRKKLTDRELDELSSTIQEELMKSIPKLIDNYSHNPDAIAQVLRLHELLDLNIYRQLHSEAQYIELIGSVIKQFKTHKQSVVIEECANVFVKATTGEDALAFSDEVRSKFLDLLDDVSYDLRVILASSPSLGTQNVNIEDDPVIQNILEPLTKIDCLSRTLDIRKAMDTPLKEIEDNDGPQEDILLAEKLKGMLSNASMYPPSKTATLLVVSIANLLRSYTMWNLGALVESATMIGVGSNPPGPLDLSAKASDFTTDLIQEFELIVDQAEPLHIRSLCAKSLLDLLVTVNVTIAQVSSLATGDAVKRSRLFDLPSTIADSTQQEILGLYLKKEKAYAKAAKIVLEEGPHDSVYRDALRPSSSLSTATQAADYGETAESDPSADEMDLEDDVGSDTDTLGGGPDGMSSTQTMSQLVGTQGAAQSQILDHNALLERTRSVSSLQQRLLLLDHDLCQFTAKIRVASLAQVISEEHAARLSLNVKALSPLFGKIVGARITYQEETTTTTAAAAAAAASAAGNGTSRGGAGSRPAARKTNQTSAAASAKSKESALPSEAVGSEDEEEQEQDENENENEENEEHEQEGTEEQEQQDEADNEELRDSDGELERADESVLIEVDVDDAEVVKTDVIETDVIGTDVIETEVIDTEVDTQVIDDVEATKEAENDSVSAEEDVDME